MLINYVEMVEILSKMGYLSKDRHPEADARNKSQIVDVWELLKGSGTAENDEEKIKLVNIKRFLCAMENLPTDKLLRKRIPYDKETYRDEVNNFYTDEAGLKKLSKKFRPII